MRGDPAALNGRRRGTKDFLGRDILVSQSRAPRPKAHAADPVEVFGAASIADTAVADKPSMRIKTLGLVHPSRHQEKEGIILRHYAVRVLTIEAIDVLAGRPPSDHNSDRDRAC